MNVCVRRVAQSEVLGLSRIPKNTCSRSRIFYLSPEVYGIPSYIAFLS